MDAMTNPPPSFHLLAKPTGAACNLDCAYCFFLEKERLYPDQRTRMSGRHARALHPPADRGAPDARGHHRLAGRRADADGARVLPPGRGARKALCTARHDRAAHHPDQRHQGRRGLGALLRRERLPRGSQHRRAARAARRLPARQGRQADLRQGRARPRGATRARRPVERAHHRQRGQRGAPGRGLPLPARPVRLRVRAVHPDRGASLQGRRPLRRRRSPTAPSRPQGGASS